MRLTCLDCGANLPPAGRGRPRERCKTCQTIHRRNYLRDRKRAERAAQPVSALLPPWEG